MAQSPELASGAGFAFEDQVGASFLAALLCEGHAPGTSDRVVSRVAFQQRDFGEPLDDIVVDARGHDNSCRRLSLQCKQSLTISDAASNQDFRSIIRDSWNSRLKTDFRQLDDCYGAAVGFVATDSSRALRQLCDYARNSEATEHFLARFAEQGNASEAVARVKAQIAHIIEEEIGPPCSQEQLHDFLAHFVLLDFDFLTEGSASKAAVLNQIATALAGPPGEAAPSVWARLCLLARESSGRSGVFSRERLVRELSLSTRLLGARSLRPDLEIIANLSRQWIADIEPEISGTSLERPVLRAKLDQALEQGRFVQITGLPGSGKSVLLRHRAEAALREGPIVFLKHDRLDGRSWEGFAKLHGMSSVPLKKLLAEIASIGSPIAFIDGLDRVSKENRGVVLDVIRSILTDDDLAEWRILVSLRSTSMETVSNWLGRLVAGASVRAIEVGALSDEDARLLVGKNVRLRDVLFGLPKIREIARRPFFARILAEDDAGDANREAPQSEVDLARRWWARGGGVEVDDSRLAKRQRTLLELAGLSVRSLGKPISLSAISDSAAVAVDEFVRDAVLSRAPEGHGLNFSHDIFLEWSLFHLLQDRHGAWLSELHSWGEPPAAGRAVELKSQSEFLSVGSWPRILRDIQGAGMRSQWARAWLIAPLSLPSFTEREAAYWELLATDNARLLNVLLVWFQAERTTPNPRILARENHGSDRARLADLLGWPSDFRAWQRLIHFLLQHASEIPRSMRLAVLTTFDVWQNAYSTLSNPTSSALLRQCELWLAEIEEGARAARESNAVYIRDRSPEGFRALLVALMLRSAPSEPEPVERYLRNLLAREISNEEFEQVISWAPTLAASHPSLLVDVTLARLREDLPAVRDEARRQREAEDLDARKRVEAKDPTDRTQSEQHFLSSPMILHRDGPDSHDWERLATDRGDFFPASPLREPFASFFREAPNEALRLVSQLGNHAITAWRQLHQLDHRRSGTPLPLVLDFPWGQQVFWGGSREYLWARGVWAPPPIQCGFMTLEEWAIAEFDANKDLDGLLRIVLADHESIAALSVAVSLALHADQVSEAVLPLLTSQRLLEADKERFGYDFTGAGGVLIGFNPGQDAAHVAAIRAAQSRPARRRHLASLIARSTLGGGPLAERVRQAVAKFPDDPAFSYEEQRDSEDVRRRLNQEAIRYLELTDPATYKLYATSNSNEVIVVHESPSASTPQAERARSEAKKSLDTSNAWMWAAKCFEVGSIVEGLELSTAIAFARDLDDPDLFEEAYDEVDVGQRQGAVAGVAAVCVAFATDLDASDLGWARGVLARAGASAGLPGAFSVSVTELPWHHAIFAARGIAREIRRGSAPAEASSILLRLVGHPLEAVALAALRESFQVWDRDPRLGWCSLLIVLRLLEIDLRARDRDFRCRSLYLI